MKRTKVAILGAGFIADIHCECYHRFIPEAEVVAVYSRNASKSAAFAKKWEIPNSFSDLDDLLSATDCEVVDVCLPNFLHYEAVIKSARSGRHIIIEKPLCMNLNEADQMIQICAERGSKLMYAEELCFAPKYERVRKLVREGAVGNIFQLRQCEKHSGPHSEWFYDATMSGGGAIMDMGCHGIAWSRWILGNQAKVRSVYATLQSGLLHKPRTSVEENSIITLEFESGAIAIIENSWAKHGGMDDRIEVYGDRGVIYADLFMGNSALTYSEQGYGYAMEKAGSTRGWSFTAFEEAFNQGYPQELKHFVECVQRNSQPLVTGEDGRHVLEIVLAAYQSARLGIKVHLPFSPTVAKPIDLWLQPA